MKQIEFLKKLNGNSSRKILYLLAFALMLTTQSVLGQTKMITGKVLDENKQPLPGVSVALKNTPVGTQTDVNGNFKINVPTQSTNVLVFGFIGYKSQSITIGNRSDINITMDEDIAALSEVVVVGYGTQKKESVVGAISTINGDALTERGIVSNLTDALTGLVPGLSVLSVSGLPGGSSSTNSKVFTESEILIRGKTTWNSSAPLILVDGVERQMNDIDISEVETVSVLKDASATAVFGVKGGNGVILITTKRGKAGKSTFGLNAEMAYETPSKQIETMDIPSSAIARNYALERARRFSQGSWDELYLADEEIDYYRNNTYPYAYQNLNWADMLYKDAAKSYRINATGSGGSEKAKYFASASYNHVGDLLNSQELGQGYLPAYSYNRLNIRSNFDFTLTKTTTLAANFAGIYSATTNPTANAVEGLFGGPSQFSGDEPILRYEDGVYGADNSRFEASNPFYMLNFMGVESGPRTSITMDYSLTQKLDVIAKGLQATGKLAYDNIFATDGKGVKDYGNIRKTINKEFYLQGGYYDYTTKTYVLNGQPANMDDWTTYVSPAASTDGFGWVKRPNTYDGENVSLGSAERNLYYEMALRYNRSFGVHNVTALTMFSRQFRERGSDWPGKREDWVGRLTYDYDSRYLLEINGAYNGSEKFGPDYRFDFFPSASVGWVLSQEKFLKDTQWLDQLKVRYSYGLVGNDRVNTGSTWPYLTIYDTYNFGGSGATYYGYPTGYDQLPKYNEGNPGNPELRWEKAAKQNLGIDFAAFKNKLSITAELFSENRKDMLIAAADRANTVAPIYGKPAPPANIGQATSRGAELMVNYRNSINRDIKYFVRANWSVARSKVLYKESTALTLPHQRPEGNPIDQTTASISAGIVNSWDDLYVYAGGANASANGKLLPGDMALVDYNGDGRYDRNDDRAPYGYPTYPQNNYGFSLGGDFKGFDLALNFVGAYNATRNVAPFLFYKDNLFVPSYLLNHTWTPAYGNSNPDFPALALESLKSDAERGNYGEFHERDGSFLRLQSAQIGYSLPKKWITSVGVSNARLYINGGNLFLWTRMPNDGVGIDNPGKNYPTRKQLNFGLNVKF